MSDYRQRMIREHRELQERISKLAHMLEGYAEGTLDRETLYAISCLQQLRTTLGLQDRKEHGR